MDQVELSVRVIPNASRDEIVGWHDGSLKVKTSAQPESGKANKAICLILSKHLGLSKRSVEVVKGHASQSKQIKISGLSENALFGKLPPQNE